MLEYLMLLESNILLWIQNNLRNDILTNIFLVITSIADNGVIWIGLSILLMVSKKTRKVGVMSLVAFLFAILIDNVILKNLVARTRPYEVIDGLTSLIGVQKDYSFPSGHTGFSFATAVVMLCGLKKRYGIPILIFAFVIGFSRLYVGVHYPSDVFCGAIIGTIIALLTYWRGTLLIKKIKKKSEVSSSKE